MLSQEVKNLIEKKDYFTLLTTVESEEIFFFKSKYQDFYFLGFDQANTFQESVPVAYIGNFENGATKVQYKNFLIHLRGEAIYHFEDDVSFKKNESANHFSDKTYLTSESVWENMIDKTKKLFQDNTFQKIVLKRDTTFNVNQFNWKSFVRDLLENNNQANDSYFMFYKNKESSFVSLTPERLFLKENDIIESMALASSMPISENQEVNLQNENYLLNDPKLIEEHRLVVDDIKSIFESHFKDTTVSDVGLMKLEYIMHREQTLKAHDLNKSVDEVIKLLHPTPAVGTLPRKDGIKIINEIENQDRNFYAAPFGVSFNKFAEIAVALRSATVKDNIMTIHSGCGVVNASEAKAEWDETENKMRPILKAIR